MIVHIFPVTAACSLFSNRPTFGCLAWGETMSAKKMLFDVYQNDQYDRIMLRGR
jgi:hypothetical protein